MTAAATQAGAVLACGEMEEYPANIDSKNCDSRTTWRKKPKPGTILPPIIGITGHR